jgi:hypothetical protein
MNKPPKKMTKTVLGLPFSLRNKDMTAHAKASINGKNRSSRGVNKLRASATAPIKKNIGAGRPVLSRMR